MATANDLNVSIGAEISGLQKGLNDAGKALDKFEVKIKKLSKIGDQMQSIGKKMSIGITVPLTAIATLSTKAFSELEGVKTAFERLNDPNLLSNLQKATKGTVSDLELMKNAVKANNFKIPMEQLGTLLEFARRRAKDTGESVDYLVNSIVTGIGRKSPLILDNLGISTSALTDELNGAAVASSSIADVTKAVGKIASNELLKMGKDTDTFSEKMGQAGATIQNALGEIGAIIAPMLSPLVDWLKRAVDGFKALSPETKKFIVVAGSIAAAIGPILVGIGSVIKLLPIFIAGLSSVTSGISVLTGVIAANPFGALAVGIAAVASYFLFFRNEVNKTVTQQQTLAKVTDLASQSIVNEKAKVASLIAVAKGEFVFKEKRIEAIKELNRISPKYLGNLTLEKINTDEAKKSINEYNKALLETAKIKAAQDILQDNQKKQIDAEIEYSKIQKKLALEYAQQWKSKEEGVINLGRVNEEVIKTELKNSKLVIDSLKEEEKQILKIITANSKRGIIAGNASTGGTDPTTGLKKVEPIVIPLSFGLDNGQRAKEKLQAEIDELRGFANSYDVGSTMYDFWNKALGKKELELAALSTNEKVKGSYELLKSTVLTEGQVAALEIQAMNQQIADAFGPILSDNIMGGISNTFQGIGDAISSGGDVMQALGQGLINAFSGFLSDMGDMLIKYGTLAVLKGKLDTAIAAGGPVAIGAGIAAIAVGALLKVASGALGSRAKGGFSGGGSTGGSTGNISDNNYRPSTNVQQSGGFNGGTVVFEISGQKLVGILSSTLERNKRTGGSNLALT